MVAAEHLRVRRVERHNNLMEYTCPAVFRVNVQKVIPARARADRMMLAQSVQERRIRPSQINETQRAGAKAMSAKTEVQLLLPAPETKPPDPSQRGQPLPLPHTGGSLESWATRIYSSHDDL